jgi:hypothetical protein
MRLIIASLTAICLSISAFAYSGPPDLDNPNVALEKIGEKKIQLTLLRIPEGRVVVTIKNAEKIVIFKDVIKSGIFTKKNYNLQALASGNYSVEIFSKKEGPLENFEISLPSEVPTPEYYAKIRFIDKDNIVFLVKSTNLSKKTVRVFHKNQKIFEEGFIGDSFGKVFKFENVASLKDLYFEVRDENGFGKYVSTKLLI